MSRHANHRRLQALIVVGGSLAALPAIAIELGDLTVHSSLGQPLQASIAYALAPTERLFSDCVSLGSGATASGLPNVGGATISVADGVIKLTGNTAIREPMVAAQLRVNCPYSANISREYMLFVDPPIATYEQTNIVQHATTPVAKATVAPAPVRPVERTRVTVQKDIKPTQRYQVRPGDSVSLIAQRIENRGVGLWAAVDAIFAANPDAFISNDPNKLKAGAWLVVPNFNSVEPISTDIALPAVVDDHPVVEPTVVEPTATEIVVIPDTELVAPESTSTSPNVVTAAIASDTVTSGATRDSGLSSWWMWLGGGSIAIALAVMLLGRRSRIRPRAIAAVAANENLGRRTTDATHPILEDEIMPTDDHDETMITDSYTIKRDADFQVLEQDYENEMTATQVLNEEITRAAAELAALKNDDENAAPSDETAVLRLASVTELDVTSQLSVQQQTIGDDEDTGINETLTENMSLEDNTVVMPAADNDERTVEMPVKTG